MEVMSSLLLYALAALAPQALAKQILKKSSMDLQFNNTVLYQKYHKHKLLLDTQPLNIKPNDIHSVFDNTSCNHCMDCMKRAIKAQKTSDFLSAPKPSTNDQHNHFVINDLKSRKKRDLTATQKPEKRAKAKKSKSTTVTKFSFDGEVLAIRVKDMNSSTDSNGSCEVFSVTNRYGCNTPEGDAIIADVKKGKRVMKTSTTEQPVSSTVPTILQSADNFRKRNADDAEIPENVMPSIEEFY